MNIEEAREAVKKGTCIDLTCPGCDVSKLEKARVFISGWEAAVKKCAGIVDREEVPDPDDAPIAMKFSYPVDVAIATVIATKKNIKNEILKLLPSTESMEGQ